MGNITTLLNDAHKHEFAVKNSFKDSLEQLNGKYHSYLGQIILWKHSNIRANKASVFSKVINANQYEETFNLEHKERCKIQHNNILKYYGCCYSYLSFQGNLSQVQLFYEYEHINLQAVLNHHHQLSAHLEEPEIWKIAMQIISACSFLEKFEKYHGDINLNTIFIDQNKNIKILYYQAFPDLISSFVKYVKYRKGIVYFSPQAMQDYANQQCEPQFNPYKQDSFSLGMTLLELMTIQQSIECYDFDQKQVKYQLIMERLGSARKRYSQQLIELVKRLLTFDEYNRPTLSRLLFTPLLQATQQNPPKFTPQGRIRRNLSPQLESKPSQVIRYLSPQINRLNHRLSATQPAIYVSRLAQSVSPFKFNTPIAKNQNVSQFCSKNNSPIPALIRPTIEIPTFSKTPVKAQKYASPFSPNVNQQSRQQQQQQQQQQIQQNLKK